MQEPVSLDFCTVDGEWALKEAESIIASLPPSENANSSGKFYRNYQCWHFFKDSRLPLIATFVDRLHSHRSTYETQFQRPLKLGFIVLSLVEDASNDICLWHRDGHFFDGQAHLTVLGNARVEVKVAPNENVLIERNAGSVWYLNGSKYDHRIRPSSGRRIELLAPIRQREEDVAEKLRAVRPGPEMWVDGTNVAWSDLRRRQAKYVLNSIEQGLASNLRVADFSVDPRESL